MIRKITVILFFFLSVTFAFSFDIGRDIVKKGSALLGTPYRYGGTTPTGFDCSGLVNYLYKPHIPDLPRKASAMARFGTTVSKDAIIPGDLVFYATGRDRLSITHVGIYIGQNTLIQAVSAGPVRGVVLTDFDEKYWKERFVLAKRVIKDQSSLKGDESVDLQYSKGHYKGMVDNLEPEGVGLMELENGDFYKGDFQKGLFNGMGEYHYSNGDVYSGRFDKGRESGGELIRSDGSRYSAFRNESGVLIINNRADRSTNRKNYFLEVPDKWDRWMDQEQKAFNESINSDNQAVEDEMKRFEEWKKESGL